MGGAVKVIKSVFSSPKPAPVQVTQPQTEPKVETPAVDTAQTKAKLMGSGYGGKTILSSAAGVEEEANVQKTILGGGRKKRIKT